MTSKKNKAGQCLALKIYFKAARTFGPTNQRVPCIAGSAEAQRRYF